MLLYLRDGAGCRPSDCEAGWAAGSRLENTCQHLYFIYFIPISISAIIMILWLQVKMHCCGVGASSYLQPMQDSNNPQNRNIVYLYSAGSGVHRSYSLLAGTLQEYKMIKNPELTCKE